MHEPGRTLMKRVLFCLPMSYFVFFYITDMALIILYGLLFKTDTFKTKEIYVANVAKLLSCDPIEVNNELMSKAAECLN